MLFKHPAILYALFALLIPVIIHLFKLRKFQKTAFTNVAFLEKIKLQTRKSSQLKKWLLLLSRLLLFTSIIFAFTEPYLPATTTEKKPEKYLVYLDNSFSMQAKGANGPLLQRAIQELIESIDENQVFTLFTNTEVYKDIRIAEAQNEILEINYCPYQLNPNQVLLKAKKLSSKEKNAALLVISDFQEHSNFDYTKLIDYSNGIVKLVPEELKNAAIDSLWLNKKNNELLLNIAVSSTNINEPIPLSVYNNTNLIGKAQVDFSEQKQQIINIPLPKNKEILGQITLLSSGLSYDNNAYFSINKQSKIKVLSIGNANATFLEKIYTENEFEFKNTSLSNLNYAEINTANTIILNELQDLPTSLQQNLTSFLKNNGSLIIIPNKNPSNEFKRFLNNNGGPILNSYSKTEKKITQITYKHPILKDVFTKKVTNFQYPTVTGSFNIPQHNAILKFNDNRSFLTQQNNIFLFASPLNTKTTNFKQSPLIVPCFYSMAVQNTPLINLCFTIGKPESFTIEYTQNQDEVLHLVNKEERFIPLQQVFNQSVKISTTNLPKKAGNYTITNTKTDLATVSYNYPTLESNLTYNTTLAKNKKHNSVTEYYTNRKAAFKIQELWKWFLIFALFFVLIELLLLKFLK